MREEDVFEYLKIMGIGARKLADIFYIALKKNETGMDLMFFADFDDFKGWFMFYCENPPFEFEFGLSNKEVLEFLAMKNEEKIEWIIALFKEDGDCGGVWEG